MLGSFFSTLNHKNLIKVLGFGVDTQKYTKHFYAMELMDYNLNDIIYKRKEPSTIILKNIARQIVEGMQALQNYNIIHGNLRPQNILVFLTSLEFFLIGSWIRHLTLK